MAKHGLTLVLVLAMLAGGGATPLHAQAGHPLAGHWAWGIEVSGFRPCTSDVVYWIWFEDGEAVARYNELVTEPYGEVFVRIAAWFHTGPRGAFAEGEEYDATLRGTRLDSIRPPSEGDCEGVAPPLWLQSAEELCDDPTTLGMVECGVIRLVAIDRELQRYTEEALRFATSTGAELDGFMNAQRAWDRYRDVQCMSVYESNRDGSWRSLTHLACRIGLAEDRLRFIWNSYLRGRATELREPIG